MKNDSMSYCYSYYGLNVLSFIYLPELSMKKFGKADVIISLGKVKEKYTQPHIVEALHYDSSDCFIFKMENSVFYQVSEGTNIIVQLPIGKEIDFHSLRLYLLYPVFNALLLQRKMTLFHASVVSKNRQSIAIAGKSGFGKSTIAAELCLMRGYNFVADDVCALAITEGPVYRILPSAPRLKIMPDAMERLNLECGNFERISENTGKLSIPVTDRLQNEDAYLTAFFVLSETEDHEIGIVLLKGVEKVASLIKNSLWFDYLKWMGKQESVFRECSAIAQNTNIYLLSFDKRVHLPEMLASVIENTLMRN